MEGLKVEIIYGVKLEASIDLGASLRLEPFRDLPFSWQKGLVEQRRYLEYRWFDERRFGDPVALTMRFPFLPALADPVGWPDEVYFDHYKAMMHEQLEEINKIKTTPPVGISLDAA